MRKVTWKDGRGYLHVSMLRDNDPDEVAAQGIPIDPPDIVGGIDCEEVKKEVHNQLVQQGLFEWADVMRKQNAVTSILMHVLRRKVIELFRAKEREKGAT